MKAKLKRLADAALAWLIPCGLLVTLAGCKSAPTTITSPPVVHEVQVPVSVPCKTETPTKPAFAVDALPLGADIWEQMQALRAERIQRKGYERELEAAVAACQ